MAEPHSSNFRVITTNVLGVRIFRKFMVTMQFFQVSQFFKFLQYIRYTYQCLMTSAEHDHLYAVVPVHLYGASGNRVRTAPDPAPSPTGKHRRLSISLASFWWELCRLEPEQTVDPHLLVGLENHNNLKFKHYLILHMTKPTKWYVHPTKTKISLCICPYWSGLCCAL